MSDCKRYTPQNDQVESLLFDKIFNIVHDGNVLNEASSELAADELYSELRTDDFRKRIFGDYINFTDKDSKLYTSSQIDSIKERTDENEEPYLYFDKVLNKHYFKDMDNERVYYPHNQGLINLFTVEDISVLRETMALKFYENLEFDWDQKEFYNSNDVNIRNIVEEFLDYKSAELLNDPDFYTSTMYGNSVEMSKDYIDEWVQEVKDYFETKGLTLKTFKVEEEEQREIEDTENSPRETVKRVESFLINSKDNANNNIKLFLSLLRNDTHNKFNEFEFIPFDEVYATLNTILANNIAVDDENGNIENIYDIFLDKIKEHGEYKPYLLELYDRIKNIDNENFKYQLVNAFYLTRKRFLGSDITIENGQYFYEIKDLSEVSARKKGVITDWLYILNQNGNQIKQFRTVKDNLTQRGRQLAKTPTEETYSSVFDTVLMQLALVGTPIQPEALKYHIQTKYGKTLEERVYGIKEVINSIEMAVLSFDTKTDQIADLLNNSAFKELAEAEAFFKSEGTNASFFSGNKNKWLYSLYSHLEKTILEWKKDPSLLENHIDSSAFTRGSHYGKYFLALDVVEEEREEERKKRINDIETFVFNSVQLKNESIDAADNSSIFYVDSLADYLNKMFNHLKPNGKTFHKTALAADKNTEYQLTWGKNPSVFAVKANAGIKKDGSFRINSEVKDIFYEYFKSEYYRMIEVHDDIDNGEVLKVNYHTEAANGKLSQLFPSLSPTFKNGVATNPSKLSSPIYDETGRPIYDDLDVIKDEIMPHIVEAIKQNIDETVQILEDARLSYYSISGFRKFQGIDSTILDSYVGNARKYKKNLTQAEKESRKEKLESGFYKLAADFTINSIISQVEYSKLISGDIAYYKNILDYKKRVPATYTDGKYLTLLSNKEKIFNAAIIAAVEYDTPSLEKLKSRLPEQIYNQYKNTNATDGQAWITPERWFFIMKRLGKSNNTLKSIYKKFYEEKPVFTQKELKVLAQPLKGVYFSNINGEPVYLKYSQAVLLPRVIKNTPLEKLYNLMTSGENKVDELITIDAIKVGAITPTVTHNEDGSVKNEEDITLNVMELSNAHWKLQQDLPTKGIKPRELGSQIQKNIFQGLAYNLKEKFDIGGQEVTGAEAIVYINDLFGALSNKGTKKFMNQLNVDKDYQINNEDALFNNLLNQLKSRTVPNRNIINGIQSRTSPFGIPGMYPTFQNIFSSLSNRSSIKIKTNGGGYIQMADYGLSKDEATKQEIVFTPWFEKNQHVLEPPVVGINPVTGKEVIRPGGIFISGSFIAKHIPNYASMPPNQLFGTAENNYTDGKIDQRILRNIIGYRIPNQSLASNDALQVMGILPEEIGDTVIAYTGITTKTGSDFDIDKLFLMMPSYKARYTTEKDNNPYKNALNFMTDTKWSDEKVRSELFKIGEAPSGNLEQDWNDIAKRITEDSEYEYFDDFREHKSFIPKIKSAKKLEYIEIDPELPIEQQSAEALQNKLIEAYKGVLTNIAAYEQLMNPIDVPHIKNDIKSLILEDERVDMSEFSGVMDLQLKNNFRLGKTGLGQVVNFLVDSVRGSMGELYFIEDRFAWGNRNSRNETALDFKNSEKLTKTEKKDYVTNFNKHKPDGVKELTIADMDKFEELEITETFMGLVNGFVDIAKDDYIVKGNWTTRTNNLGLTLLRAGVHPFKINAFLKQPIIEEYMRYSDALNSKNIEVKGNIEHLFKLHKFHETFRNSEMIDVNGTTRNLYELTQKIVSYSNIKRIKFFNPAVYEESSNRTFRIIKNRLYKEFGLNPAKEDSSELNEVMDKYTKTFHEYFNAPPMRFNSKSMLELRNQILEEADNSYQIGIFETFLEWNKKAKELTKVVSVNKADVNGKGKNITSNVISLNLAAEVLNATEKGKVGGYKTLLNFGNSPTILNYSLVNGVSNPFKIIQNNPKFFPTGSKGAIRTFNFIARLLGENNLNNETLGDSLEKVYYSYLMSGFSKFKLSSKEQISLIKNTPDELKKMKSLYPDNKLLLNLDLYPTKKPDLFYIGVSGSNKTSDNVNSIINGWADLLNEEPEFGEKLIQYSFLESSFNNSITQFHEYIPYQWFNRNRLNSYLKNLNLDAYLVDFNFIDQYFRNNINIEKGSIELTDFNSEDHPLDREGKYLKLGPVVTKDNITQLKYIAYYDTRNEQDMYYQEMTEGSTTPTFEYYKLIGINEDDQTIYARTTPLGTKDSLNNKFNEYSLNTTDNKYGLESIFGANVVNHLIDNKISINRLETLTKKATNYDFPQESYNKLDTIPLESFDLVENTDGKVDIKNMLKDLVMSEKSGILEPSNELEELWNKYEKQLSDKHVNITLDTLISLSEQMDIKEIEAYIQKCI